MMMVIGECRSWAGSECNYPCLLSVAPDCGVEDGLGPSVYTYPCYICKDKSPK